jgi:pimeloyl-ACP methyl ester carboxylesterase
MKIERITRPAEPEAAGPPLVFVHGTGHAAWCWDEHFLGYFAEHGYPSLALSLRGHGASDGRQGLRWAGGAAYVDDVRDLPVVVGHSLGGLVVQRYLEQYDAAGAVLLAPSPARGMWLQSTRLSLSHPWLFLKAFLAMDLGVLFATPARARRFLFSADTSDEDVERHAARLGPESFRVIYEMNFSRPRVRAIRSRNRPLLVVGASGDVIVPPREVRLTARAYEADCEVIPGLGHDMMLERSWVTAAATIRKWLDRRFASRSPRRAAPECNDA